MKILILGGTADARRLCDCLVTSQFELTYSIAGLVRTPDLPCKVEVGGFRQFGGLTQYIEDNHIDLILDVTHPYAKKMSDQAVISASETGIEVWRFQRPAWIKSDEDNWLYYQNFDDLLLLLRSFHRPLLSAGQFTLSELSRIECLESIESVLWRTAVTPKFDLASLPKLHWKKAIGPFLYEDEKILIQTQDIDVIVSKNSGGSATSAKLQVAQNLGLKVLMLERPNLLVPNREFHSLDECANAIMTSRI